MSVEADLEKRSFEVMMEQAKGVGNWPKWGPYVSSADSPVARGEHGESLTKSLTKVVIYNKVGPKADAARGGGPTGDQPWQVRENLGI